MARGDDVSVVDRALAADQVRRDSIAHFETLRAEQNTHGKLVAAASKEDRVVLVAAAQDLAERVKIADKAATEAGDNFTRVAGEIGNVIIDGVPAGGEENFVTLREVGDVPTFDFEPRDHLELGEMLGAIDMNRGTKVSGSRFYFLSGIGARLEIALMSLALDRALDHVKLEGVDVFFVVLVFAVLVRKHAVKSDVIPKRRGVLPPYPMTISVFRLLTSVPLVPLQFIRHDACSCV
jgi:seryl-tRNA synthetase